VTIAILSPSTRWSCRRTPQTAHTPLSLTLTTYFTLMISSNSLTRRDTFTVAERTIGSSAFWACRCKIHFSPAYRARPLAEDATSRSIEDVACKNCEGIIHDAVVIGKNRPLPVLTVEVASPSLADDNFRHTGATWIVKRMSKCNDRKSKWYRVDNLKRIIIVAQGSLPRTREKGNISSVGYISFATGLESF
jgi:hypothetical protein